MICFDCEIWEEYQELKAENAELRAKLSEQEECLAQFEIENGKLRRHLALYENANTPPSRRRYPSRKRAPSSGRRFPGKPRGSPGRTRPVPRPDVVRAPDWPENCERCGAPLEQPEYVSHHVREEISNPSPKLNIDFLELGGECKACGAYNIARHPDCPPDGMFGKNALIQVTLMKFEERLPLEKVRETLDRVYGLSVTTPTVFDITRRVSDWLRPEYEKILERIRRTPVVHVDETGEKKDGRRCWLWVFATPTDILLAIRRSRGKKVPEEILGKEFPGYLVVDGLRSYPTFTRKLQRCWAHLLREADWLAEHVSEAKPLQNALHRLFNDLKASLEDDPPPGERARLARNAKRRLDYWLKRRYKSEKIKEFVQKVCNGFRYWFTFVTVPGVEPTNNRAERALKEPVVQRKIIGTFRTAKGTRIYETIMTLLATWKQRGLDLSEALAESLSTAWSRA